MMQHVSCYNCASDETNVYAVENGFTLVKCRRCGLLYVNPRPNDDDIRRAHQMGLHRGAETLDVTGSFSPAKVQLYLDVLDAFSGTEGLADRTTWLDIGCGHGEFLVALRRFSDGRIAARGVEPNTRKRQAARQKGLDVSYCERDAERGQYDAVSFLNVYSHLPDPPRSISSWKRLLKPGGTLFMQTGDTAELASRHHPKPFHLPDHLSFASQEIVEDILARCGFDVLRIKKYPLTEFRVWPAVKELVKVFCPKRRSVLRDMIYHTDMYILARTACRGATREVPS